MIKKTLLIFLFLYLSYNIFLVFLPTNFGIESIAGEGEFKRTKSEAYLYDAYSMKDRSVLVGTSLTGRIKESYISKDFINLGLEGMSAFDGLKIIEKRNDPPKAIFIEVNRLFKTENKAFQNSIFNSVNHFTPKYIPSCRTINKPILVLKRCFFELSKQFIRKNTILKSEKVFEVKADNPAYIKNIYMTPTSANVIETNFSLLEVYLTNFTQKGTKIVFYEMPTQREYCRSIALLQLRKEVKKRFSSDKFQYIEQPSCQKYDTIDGLHLTESCGLKYALFLKENLGEW